MLPLCRGLPLEQDMNAVIERPGSLRGVPVEDELSFLGFGQQRKGRERHIGVLRDGLQQVFEMAEDPDD